MNAKKFWVAAGVAMGLLGLYFSMPHADLPSADDRRGNVPDTAMAAANAATRPAANPSSAAAPGLAPLLPAPEPGDLFEYIPRPSDADRWESTTVLPADEVHYVRINSAAANGKRAAFWQTGGQGRAVLVLPDGRELAVRISHTQSLGPNRFSSEGTVEGQGYSTATFAFNAGDMSASVHDLQHGAWQLRAVGNGIAQFFQVNHAKIPPCGASPDVAEPPSSGDLRHAAGAAGGGETIELPVVAGADPVRPEVRILISYTDAVARSASQSALQSQFDLSIANLNGDLTRSQVAVTAVLAGILQVGYANDDVSGSSDKVQSDALTHLATADDGLMDAVHLERDRVKADLVCLVQNRSDTSSAGIAYLWDSERRVFNPTRGFCVVGNAYMGSTDRVFSHEIGHTFGCAHARGDKDVTGAATSSGAYSYSYGYRFNGADGVQYRTIMAYSPGMRLAFFSNPEVTAPGPISVPVGVPAGQSGEADNARTIRENAFEVASYRLSTQSPANLGTLINVSTRAFVGTGAQQLIGGFIISGSQKKRLLIRGIGPSLAQFNVPSLLADPKLRLVDRNGAELKQNDNWLAADAADMSSVGAFTLPAGSRDAALVAELDPGPYTALIEGAGGTTGTALMEAYELDRGNGPRLVNLATRGFADRARPMIAGFVVAGDPANPGKTKRILIRALGPTLANLGVTDAMSDPTFTLYDADGRQLLFNDDWSSGSDAGDDFKPYVRIYAEKQISATGNAPGNRRDSAAMLDLLPGAYTAVVMPFEDLPDQPAAPGVALVDVFEISQ